ncbi:MAG: MmgE/PrpD family protein [Alteromonadaceae bacterium]|nr:MmgE/PrpD family protein [Alteromonadaceae bacterium]
MSHVSQSLEQLVEYALAQRYDDLDAGTINALKTFIQDSLGVGICGARVPFAVSLKQICQQWGTGNDAQILNTGEWMPAPSAAMINAWQIHNQEFDCVHEQAVVHPMAVILAVLLAFAQREGNIDGKQLMTAISVAVDVATTLGAASRSPLTFFRPAWCGALGASIGMSWLSGHNRAQTLQVLGITYSMLGGTMQAHVEGTSMLAMQIGVAARSAVNAFDLAAAGLDGPQDILDGPYGFYALIERESDFSYALTALRQQHSINLVSHKPFPTGRACHGGLDALQVLQNQHQFSADSIARVTLYAPPLIKRLIGRKPVKAMTVSYARLCFAYSGASYILDGDVGVECYDSGKLSSAERLALAEKFVVIDDGSPDPNAMSPQRLEVELNDGRILRHDVPATLGSPARPLSRLQHLTKFRRCCKSAPNPLSDAGIESLINVTDHLDKLKDINELLTLSLVID